MEIYIPPNQKQKATSIGLGLCGELPDDLGVLEAAAKEIENAISHLKRSNKEIQDFDPHGEDPELLDAIEENIVALQRKEERLQTVREKMAALTATTDACAHNPQPAAVAAAAAAAAAANRAGAAPSRRREPGSAEAPPSDDAGQPAAAAAARSAAGAAAGAEAEVSARESAALESGSNGLPVTGAPPFGSGFPDAADWAAADLGAPGGPLRGGTPGGRVSVASSSGAAGGVIPLAAAAAAPSPQPLSPLRLQKAAKRLSDAFMQEHQSAFLLLSAAVC
ncbi:hypothetical protein Efla_003502 [Eimeria flavescens]